MTENEIIIIFSIVFWIIIIFFTLVFRSMKEEYLYEGQVRG